jgi:hypothetical protein
VGIAHYPLARAAGNPPEVALALDRHHVLAGSNRAERPEFSRCCTPAGAGLPIFLPVCSSTTVVQLHSDWAAAIPQRIHPAATRSDARAAFIHELTTAAQVGLTVANDGSAAGTLLEANLVNETITALFGLVKREGNQSSHHQDMFVAWDTANTAPISLVPNQTHLFELDTMAKVYGRGYGGDSHSWGNVDSSAYLAAVTRNYVCSIGTRAPTPRAHRFWATSGTPHGSTPHSSTTIQNLVRNYVQVELGVLPPNVSQKVGQYP